MAKEQQQFRSKALMPGLLTVALVSALMLSGQSAGAQGYPTRPIEIVVPWGAGTNMDILSRMIADKAPKYLGQSMFVTNKPGASGSIGAADVIASKADGYKLSQRPTLFCVHIHTMKLPFDPNDLVPLANFADLRQGMLVRADSPFRPLATFLPMPERIPAS